MNRKIAIAGAGFAGAVLARELAESGRFDVTVFDRRPHVAGNCHTFRDKQTNIMLHEYGPHIFNTSSEEVWRYVNNWGEFRPFVNRVKAVTERGVFSLPVNLLTINQFFDRAMDPREARAFIDTKADRSIEEPQNFAEQALKFLGAELYENFFRGYTQKQWGVDPRELPASILKRLPVRFNYDDNYYNQTYQGIPVEGYSAMVTRILDHGAITLKLATDFDPAMGKDYDHTFWSGPIDGYFAYEFGRLRYRTVAFERFDYDGDYQGNPVINYCSTEVPFTRIAEHKHFTPWETHDKTVCFREYSRATGPEDTPFYPLRLAEDLDLLNAYAKRATSERNLSFIGRLGTYRYLDMHVVIGESLALSRACLTQDLESWPRFSGPLA